MIKTKSYYREAGGCFVVTGEHCLKKGISEENLIEVVWQEDCFVSKRGQWLDKENSVTPISGGYDDSRRIR